MVAGIRSSGDVNTVAVVSLSSYVTSGDCINSLPHQQMEMLRFRLLFVSIFASLWEYYGTGIEGLTGGLPTLPKPLVVKDRIGRPKLILG